MSASEEGSAIGKVTAAIVGPGNIGTDLCSRRPKRWWPFIGRLPWMDRASVVQGYAGVYSSFLLHAQRAALRYGVPAHAILQRVGEAGYVGGQEDMIIDVALQLQEEGSVAGGR